MAHFEEIGNPAAPSESLSSGSPGLVFEAAPARRRGASLLRRNPKFLTGAQVIAPRFRSRIPGVEAAPFLSLSLEPSRVVLWAFPTSSCLFCGQTSCLLGVPHLAGRAIGNSFPRRSFFHPSLFLTYAPFPSPSRLSSRQLLLVARPLPSGQFFACSIPRESVSFSDPRSPPSHQETCFSAKF